MPSYLSLILRRTRKQLARSFTEFNQTLRLKLPDGNMALEPRGQKMKPAREVVSFLGVPGLRANVYSVCDPKTPDSTVEYAIPDLSGLGKSSGGPLGAMLPFINDSIMRELPLENIRFIFSEHDDGLVYSRGLRVEADLKFDGALSFVRESLDQLLGGRGKSPEGLRITAYLGEERVWDERPFLSALRLQGSFNDLSAWMLEDAIRLKTVGVELSSVSTCTMGRSQDRWAFAYGFFGSIELHKLPGCEAPLEVSYRATKTGDVFQMSMRLASEDWKNAFGVRNLHVSAAVRVNTL